MSKHYFYQGKNNWICTESRILVYDTFRGEVNTFRGIFSFYALFKWPTQASWRIEVEALYESNEMVYTVTASFIVPKTCCQEFLSWIFKIFSLFDYASGKRNSKHANKNEKVMKITECDTIKETWMLSRKIKKKTYQGQIDSWLEDCYEW